MFANVSPACVGADAAGIGPFSSLFSRDPVATAPAAAAAFRPVSRWSVRNIDHSDRGAASPYTPAAAVIPAPSSGRPVPHRGGGAAFGLRLRHSSRVGVRLPERATRESSVALVNALTSGEASRSMPGWVRDRQWDRHIHLPAKTAPRSLRLRPASLDRSRAIQRHGATIRFRPSAGAFYKCVYCPYRTSEGGGYRRASRSGSRETRAQNQGAVRHFDFVDSTATRNGPPHPGVRGDHPLVKGKKISVFSSEHDELSAGRQPSTSLLGGEGRWLRRAGNPAETERTTSGESR